MYTVQSGFLCPQGFDERMRSFYAEDSVVFERLVYKNDEVSGKPEVMSPELEMLLDERIEEVLLETTFDNKQTIKEEIIERLGVDPTLDSVDQWLEAKRRRIPTWKMLRQETCLNLAEAFAVRKGTLPWFSAQLEPCRGCLR